MTFKPCPRCKQCYIVDKFSRCKSQGHPNYFASLLVDEQARILSQRHERSCIAIREKLFSFLPSLSLSLSLFLFLSLFITRCLEAELIACIESALVRAASVDRNSARLEMTTRCRRDHDRAAADRSSVCIAHAYDAWSVAGCSCKASKTAKGRWPRWPARFLLAGCIKADKSLHWKINASWENDTFSRHAVRIYCRWLLRINDILPKKRTYERNNSFSPKFEVRAELLLGTNERMSNGMTIMFGNYSDNYGIDSKVTDIRTASFVRERAQLCQVRSPNWRMQSPSLASRASALCPSKRSSNWTDIGAALFLPVLITALYFMMHHSRSGITRERARARVQSITRIFVSDVFPLSGKTLSTGCRSSFIRNQRTGAHARVASACRLLLFRSRIQHPVRSSRPAARAS